MGMKKIGILTLYYNNFNMGGLLQAYALQRFLQLSGFETEQISFDFTWHYGNGGKGRRLFREFKNSLGCKKRKEVESVFKVRIQKFQKFIEFIPHSKRIYYDVSEFASKYDAVLVGSDQVWASWLPKGALHTFLLASPKLNGKRYSYAVSLGMDVLSDGMEKQFKTALPTFENISVRETSSRNILERILQDKKLSTNLDPTLLLDELNWKKMEKRPKYESPYLLCYFLGKDKDYRKVATELAKKMGLHVVSIPYAKDHKREGFDDSFGDYADYECGPEEFIGWIDSAEAVLTDSFHATVFSCQFRKKFLTVSRKTEVGVQSMNRRLTDFLGSFGLLDRYMEIDSIKELSNMKDVDFKQYNEKIGMLRAESQKYLLNLLNHK